MSTLASGFNGLIALYLGNFILRMINVLESQNHFGFNQEVECLPIHVITLSCDGLLPEDPPGTSDISLRPEPFVCKHLPPSNLTEQTLLSIWVNTHQAMFISTGISAYCVNQITRLIDEEEDDGQILEYIDLAIACRLASAAYTSLPYLTKELYESYIRESMKQVHPGFSGVSNQEAISMEKSIRQLKKAQADLGYRNKKLANALNQELKLLYMADKTWWRHHGKAMSKLVENPVSLARADFKSQSKQNDGNKSFNEYRDQILRTQDATSDYDQYFAVKRSGQLSALHYRDVLQDALDKSSTYVDATGELASYREKGKYALNKVIDISMAMSN
jgi:hypothetical protein